MSGENFRVEAHFNEKMKWKVKQAVVREHDPGLNVPIDNWLNMAEGEQTTKRLKGQKISPFRSKWVADILQSTIKNTPGKHCILVNTNIYLCIYC